MEMPEEQNQCYIYNKRPLLKRQICTDYFLGEMAKLVLVYCGICLIDFASLSILGSYCKKQLHNCIFTN